MDDGERNLDIAYRRLFGRLAGYLPEDRAAIDAWQRDLGRRVQALRAANGAWQRHAPVAALAALIEENGVVRMYVDQMIHEVPPAHRVIESIPELLDALDLIITSAPLFEADPKKRNFFPMSSLFVYMMMTPAGEGAFRNDPFNDAIRSILKAWCQYLDGPESCSVLNTGPTGWLSPPAYALNRLDEFEIPDRSAPHWGFTSFNAYFHRQIKPAERPVDAPHDPKVIVSANDGTVYKIAREVKALDRFWLKGQPYSLANMLANSPYLPRFVGGDVFQSFLSGADYHRFRAPVAGVVRHAAVVDGLMFSDAESAGEDPTAGTYSQGYEASVNTRGLVFIESDDPTVGMVCAIPVGITEISSISLSVKAGDRVEKGSELGSFSYGGSSLCLVFQRGAIDHFTVAAPPPGGNPDDGPKIEVNARIAVAR
jgi:phosphatidylserine decarboxylase